MEDEINNEECPILSDYDLMLKEDPSLAYKYYPSAEEQRESLLKEVSESKSMDFILQLPTGFGKCRIAIEILKYKQVTDNILIVIPQNILIANWTDEFKKWNCEYLIDKITFTTYTSLKKYVKTSWSAVIFDECHHLTEAAYKSAKKIKWVYTIWLSATMNEYYDYTLNLVRKRPMYFEKIISIRTAIDNNVLPDPKVYLMRMYLDNFHVDQEIEMNTDIKEEPIKVAWDDRYKFFGKRNIRYNIHCTEEQYLTNLNNNIAYARKQYDETKDSKRQESYHNYWLHLCGQRLLFLSKMKERTVKFMLDKLDDKRVVVFCSNIEQSERICPNSINSKNKNSHQVLSDFNEGIINHISSCNMLNEGINLVDCQYGVYAVLNSSKRLIKQKLGRILRHDNPILIIPYYIETREEEIIREMIQDYNPNLIISRDAPIVPKPYIYIPDEDGQASWTFLHEGMMTKFEFTWSKGNPNLHYKLTDTNDDVCYCEGENIPNREFDYYFLQFIIEKSDKELERYEESLISSQFKIPDKIKPLILP